MRRIPCTAAAAALAAAVALAASGCNDTSPREMSVGLLVAQTGPFAARGKDLLQGAQLAAAEINAEGYLVDGRRLHVTIVPSDDRGEVGTARTEAQRLMDAGVTAIIGPANTPQAEPVLPMVAARGVPEMTTATAASLMALGQGNALRLVANDDKQGRAMAEFCEEVSTHQRIATIAEATDYGRGLAATFTATLAEKKLAPAPAIKLGRDGKLPADLVAQLRAQHVDTVALFAREPQLNALLDALEAANATEIAVVGTNVVRNRPVALRPVRIRGLYATATAIDAAEFPGGKAFVQRFRTRFGGDPVWGAQLSYDAIYALADAARQARSLDGAKLLATLKHIEPLTRVNQQMRFAENGEQIYPSIAVYKVDQGVWALQEMSAAW